MAAGIFLAGTTPAQAYFDLGTSSMVLQLIVGAIAGGLMWVKLYWRRISGFFGRDKRREKTQSD